MTEGVDGRRSSSGMLRTCCNVLYIPSIVSPIVSVRLAPSARTLILDSYVALFTRLVERAPHHGFLMWHSSSKKRGDPRLFMQVRTSCQSMDF